MKRSMIAVLLGMFLLILSGCITADPANKQDVRLVRTQVNEQVIHLEDRLNAQEGRTDAIERKLEALLGRVEDTVNNKMIANERKINELKQQQSNMGQTLSAEIDKKMNIVIEEVIKENNKIAEKINSLQKEKYDLGIYHTVGRGETLSHISVKYGVSVDDIISSNEIENPDRLKVGQKLFIPQK